MDADRLPDPAAEAKLPCNCYAEWVGDEWRIAASSFTCDHKQGDHVDGAPPVSAAVSPAEPPRRKITVTHTHSATFVQAEVDAVWNSGVLPIPDYVLSGDEATDPDARAIAVYTALDGSLLELFYEASDDDVGHEVEDYDPDA